MLKRYKLFIIVVSILGLAFIGLYVFDNLSVLVRCPFKAITGIPCPGCGGIRAIQSIFCGDLQTALYINPLSCVIFCFLCILPIWAFYDGYKDKNTLMKFLHTPWPRFYMIVLIFILIANWIWNIIKHL